jgi:excisionase family DNA binding protein
MLRERKTAWRVPELTGLLSLGKHTLYDAIESGQLTATRIGTALRISPSDALAWYEARTTGTGRKAAREEDRPPPRARRKGRKL